VVGTWAGAGGLLAPAAAIVQVDDLPVEGKELDDMNLPMGSSLAAAKAARVDAKQEPSPGSFVQ